MAVAGSVAIAAQWLGVDGAGTLAYWIGGWYLVVLTIEVKLVSSHVLTAAKAAGGAGQPDPRHVENSE